MGDKIFNGILIPYIGSPQLVSLTLKQIEEKLNCKSCDGYTIEYLECFGFHLTLFSIRDNINVPCNNLASILTKERYTVFGDSILLDDEKDLTLDDFRKIIEISKEIPNCTWFPEPEIEELYRNSSFPLELINSIAQNSGTKEQRDSIWNKIGKYYVSEHE